MNNYKRKDRNLSGMNKGRHIACCMEQRNNSTFTNNTATQTKQDGQQSNESNKAQMWENWALKNISMDTRLYIQERFGSSGEGRGCNSGGYFNNFAKEKSGHLFVIRDTDSNDPRIVAEL